MTARILIVDDNPQNAALLSLRIETEYYDVRCAADGFDALGRAVEWQPDLVLLDVMMPGMDGYETCRRLKADPLTAHIPVVMITALDGSRARLHGLECGADDFLTRPVDNDTLIARVKSLIRLKRLLDEWRARGETARSLGFGPTTTDDFPVGGARALVVDDWEIGAETVRQTLDRDGIITHLVQTEAAALELGAAHAFDLVLVSLTMRADDPLRLVSRLRAADATRDVPMLLIAEPDQRITVVRGFDLGASDWLLRPVDPHELRVRARNQIRRKFYQDRLRDGLDHALELALVDPLTGLYNRRYLLHHLGSLLGAARVREIAVLMIDLDYFKAVNDRFGHGAGDQVLGMVARVLREETRAFDLVARLGGEEFAVVMPATSADEAMRGGERIRGQIERLDFQPGAGARCGLTISIGVAVTDQRPDTADSLLQRADTALYAAKRAGRNRVELIPALP